MHDGRMTQISTQPSEPGDALASGLSVRDHMTLRTAALQWGSAGRKESHVYEVFGESIACFHHRLNLLIDTPEAEAAYPSLVHRLRRLRDQRRMARSSSRLSA